MSNYIGGLMMGLIFTILGGAMLWKSTGQVIIDSRASKNWPSTAALITENTLTYTEEGTYKLRFRVEYEVNEQFYVRSKPFLGSFGNFAWDTGEAEFVAKYPEYGEHKIFYKPNDPQTATLEQGFKKDYLALTGFSMVFFVFGTLFLFGSFFQMINAFRYKRKTDYV